MATNLPKAQNLTEDVFAITNDESFAKIALAAFEFQYRNNALYKEFCDRINKVPENVQSINAIPFLPISFFKSHKIISGEFEPEIIFQSSGTTGQVTSKHYVKSGAVYEQSFKQTFNLFYGQPEQYCILGLLPSYLERGNSSLVYMVQHLMQDSKHPSNGFYLNNFEELHQILKKLEEQQQPTILIGVTYALLDFAEHFPMPVKNTIVMETGGMKGRKKELVRSEVHKLLKQSFQLRSIHSEYGMTELLSQAYAKENGKFFTPPWMKILVREEDDPLAIHDTGTGAINVIDLANIYSCSFIATEDVGRIHPDKSFEVLGRMDHSDVRGCSLLALQNES
jgi:hypothetical protein